MSEEQLQGQMSIFDYIQTNSAPFSPLEALALHGTGFCGGMKRVLNYFLETHTLQEKAKFLKKEYGIGGFGSPVKKPCYIHEMATFENHKKDISFSYYDENMQNFDSECSFEELAKAIEKMVKENRYVKT